MTDPTKPGPLSAAGEAYIRSLVARRAPLDPMVHDLLAALDHSRAEIEAVRRERDETVATYRESARLAEVEREALIARLRERVNMHDTDGRAMFREHARADRAEASLAALTRALYPLTPDARPALADMLAEVEGLRHAAERGKND